jgi:uncharacterized delta-60 repeat protein
MAMAIQTDGKIVVAGTTTTASGNSDFFLVRYHPDGSLDKTFSGDGKVRTDFGSSSHDEANAVAIQADGKIVVAGRSVVSIFNPDIALARYNPDGSLDPTFSGDGKVLAGFISDAPDEPFAEEATAVAIQTDGKIVVAGSSRHEADAVLYALLARFNADGTPDTTFGNGPLGPGMVIFCFDSLCEGGNILSALAIQANGKIVVAGAHGEPGLDMALARYNANGTPDTTFGNDPTVPGTVVTFINSSTTAAALVLQPDNRLVVAGACFPDPFHPDPSSCPNESVFLLARYNTNGTLDPTFGGDGIVLTPFGSRRQDEARAVAIQPSDGRVVVAGSSAASFGASPADFALARYHALTCGGVVVTRINTASNVTINGTAGNDVIYDFGGNNRLNGLGGNDILCGAAGNDTLDGGDGDDVLRGGPGTDVCMGGAHVSGDKAFDCESVTGVP